MLFTKIIKISVACLILSLTICLFGVVTISAATNEVEMKIHQEFTGGNIVVTKIEGNDVYLKNETRDSSKSWFYWAFCIEGAQGKTLTFHFDKGRLGYWGPAVSHDLLDWKWHDQVDTANATFTYTFGPDEDKVYFAHSIK